MIYGKRHFSNYKVHSNINKRLLLRILPRSFLFLVVVKIDVPLAKIVALDFNSLDLGFSSRSSNRKLKNLLKMIFLEYFTKDGLRRNWSVVIN